jgi:hypothetical protein
VPTTTAAELLLAPLLAGAAGLAALRWREEVAGLVSAFPAIVGPLLLLTAHAHGATFAARTAAGTLFGLVALSAFAVVYARTAQRQPWPVALAAAWSAAALWVGLAGGVHAGPWTSPGVAGAALLLARRALPEPRTGAPRAAMPAAAIPLRMLATLALVAVLTVAADRLGARLGGILAALPVLASVLAVATHRGQGAGAALELLRGMLDGMAGFLLFCLVFAVLAPRAGVAPAITCATVCCLVAQAAVPVRRQSSWRARGHASSRLRRDVPDLRGS